MSKSKVIKALKDAGFRLKKNGKKHEIWTNGQRSVLVSRGVTANKDGHYKVPRASNLK